MSQRHRRSDTIPADTSQACTATLAGGPASSDQADGPGHACARPALGNAKKSVSTLDDWKRLRADLRRSDRYRMRRDIAALLPDSATAKCGLGRRPNGKGGVSNIEIRTNDGRSFYSGVLACGSPWICPVCGPKIFYRRSLEINQVDDVVREQGGTTVFATLTVSHSDQDPADLLVPFMSKAFGKILAGRAWYGHSGKERTRRTTKGLPVSDGLRGDLGYVGMSRAMECTHGCNGWHPHIHAALVFDKPLDDDQVDTLREFVADRWADYVEKTLKREVNEHAVDVRKWDKDEKTIGWYVTKIGQGWNLGTELTGHDKKHTKGGNENPAQISARYSRSVRAGHPDRQAADLLVEFYKATKGRPAIYISPGLRKWAGLAEEQTDEELANEDINGQVVTELSATVWTAVRSLNAEADLLRSSEQNGLNGIVDTLHDFGLRVTTTSRDHPEDEVAVPLVIFRPLLPTNHRRDKT